LSYAPVADSIVVIPLLASTSLQIHCRIAEAVSPIPAWGRKELFTLRPTLVCSRGSKRPLPDMPRGLFRQGARNQPWGPHPTVPPKAVPHVFLPRDVVPNQLPLRQSPKRWPIISDPHSDPILGSRKLPGTAGNSTNHLHKDEYPFATGRDSNISRSRTGLQSSHTACSGTFSW